MVVQRTIDLGELNIGSTWRIRPTLKKDGTIWAPDTVTFTFEKPDRSTQFTRTATLESAITGIFYYDTTVDEIDTLGYWTMTVKAVDGVITVIYPQEIGFRVVGQP